MKTSPLTQHLRLSCCIVAVLAFSIGCSGPTGAIKNDIDPAELQSGLSVLYLDGSYRFISEMPTGKSAEKRGRPGSPIPVINNQFGQGEVFDSGKSSKIGVQITGYIHLDTPGRYEFQALSNDGVQLYINGELIVSDAAVHSDRLSEIGSVAVETGKWQPFLVRYFQRKGTAALKLYWRPPGANDFTIVPERAYGHLGNPQ
ncbi:MAG: PA14 domain-containing protein [Desulforhopalus sp.]